MYKQSCIRIFTIKSIKIFLYFLKQLYFYSLSLWFGRTSAPGQTQTGLGQRVILLLPQAVLPGSDAGSDVVNQHQISSFKTVRPRIPCGTRCMGHVVRSWFAVCSMAPHSKFGKKARPHLCMDEWNRPTPVRR